MLPRLNLCPRLSYTLRILTTLSSPLLSSRSDGGSGTHGNGGNTRTLTDRFTFPMFMKGLMRSAFRPMKQVVVPGKDGLNRSTATSKTRAFGEFLDRAIHESQPASHLAFDSVVTRVAQTHAGQLFLDLTRAVSTSTSSNRPPLFLSTQAFDRAIHSFQHFCRR